MSYKILACVITAATMTLGASPAFADDSPEKTISVDIAGYDLTTDSGTDLVMHKIKRAAEQVCGVRNGPKSLSERSVERECVTQAINSAIDTVGQERARQAALKSTSEG